MYTDDQSPMSWLSGLLIRNAKQGTNNQFENNCSRNSIETTYHLENHSLENNYFERDKIDEGIYSPKIFDAKNKRLDTFSDENFSFYTPSRDYSYDNYNYYYNQNQNLSSVNQFTQFNIGQPVLESQFRFVSSLLCSNKLPKRSMPISSSTPSISSFQSSMSSSAAATVPIYDPFIMLSLPQLHHHYYSRSNTLTEYAATNSNASSIGSSANNRKSHTPLHARMRKKVDFSDLKPANFIVFDEHFENVVFDHNKIRNNNHNVVKAEMTAADIDANNTSNFPPKSHNNVKNANNGCEFSFFDSNSTYTDDTNTCISNVYNNNCDNVNFLTGRVTRSGKRKSETEFTNEMNDVRTVSTTTCSESITNSICDSMSVSEASEDAYIKSGRGRKTRRLYDDRGIKISGVWYDASRHLWRVVYLKGDKRKTKGFSILKLGYEQARRQAIAFRQMMIPPK